MKRGEKKNVAPQYFWAAGSTTIQTLASMNEDVVVIGGRSEKNALPKTTRRRRKKHQAHVFKFPTKDTC